MGNCNFKQDNDSAAASLSKTNFNFLYVVGRGGFGKVWKVEQKKTKIIYAMKEMSKARIITKRSVNSVMNERHLLSILRHPFLINMIYAFQDRENIYLVMDLLMGGDLRYHICQKRKFTEEESKFILACLINALEYLHSNGVLHRDIKPENLVFDSRGYLRLTDLGVARVWKPENSQDTSGTPGYMAPEVMCRQNHGVAVDYYALGVMAYEFMFGKRPYIGKTRKEIRDKILAKQVQIKKSDIPEGWSLEAADFINRLIQRKPINRLGLNGPAEIKQHIWFADFQWDKLNTKELQAPYVPDPKVDNFDQKSINNDPWKDENAEQQKQNALQLRRADVQSLFSGYDFEYSSPSNNSNISTATQYTKQYQIQTSDANNNPNIEQLTKLQQINKIILKPDTEEMKSSQSSKISNNTFFN